MLDLELVKVKVRGKGESEGKGESKGGGKGEGKGKGEGEGEKMSDEAAKLFPEAESMLNAIRVLSKEHGFSARDVHSRNVMMRPDSNELVIVDLGLFQIKGDT